MCDKVKHDVQLSPPSPFACRPAAGFLSPMGRELCCGAHHGLQGRGALSALDGELHRGIFLSRWTVLRGHRHCWTFSTVRHSAGNRKHGAETCPGATVLRRGYCRLGIERLPVDVEVANL